METVFRLLVLVPHRDARLPLRAWGDSLFAAGLLTAWSFPGVAPLALLKRALSGEELRSLAHLLRKRFARRHEGTEGNREWGVSSLSGGHPRNAPVLRSLFSNVWGPALNLTLPDDFFAPVSEALECPILPPVLGVALVQGVVPDSLPAPPQVSFRAAALANMECRFVPCGKDGGNGDYLLEWGIGSLQWLPKRVVKID